MLEGDEAVLEQLELLLREVVNTSQLICKLSHSFADILRRVVGFVGSQEAKIRFSLQFQIKNKNIFVPHPLSRKFSSFLLGCGHTFGILKGLILLGLA